MRVANLVVATSAAILATVAIVEAATLPSPTLTLVARGDAASNNPTAISTPLSTAVSTASSSVLSITTPAPSVKGVQAALIGSSWVPALKGCRWRCVIETFFYPDDQHQSQPTIAQSDKSGILWETMLLAVPMTPLPSARWPSRASLQV